MQTALTGTFRQSPFWQLRALFRERGLLDSEVAAAVGIVVKQVGAGPVEHGHEVVANGMDTLGCEVAQALLVNINLFIAVGTSILDCFGHGQRLDDAPTHAVTLDEGL